MADNTSTPADPMAAASNAMMASIQDYIRTAVTTEVANLPNATQPAQLAALQSRLETANQENSELKEKIKQIESKKSTRHSHKRTFFLFPLSLAQG